MKSKNSSRHGQEGQEERIALNEDVVSAWLRFVYVAGWENQETNEIRYEVEAEYPILTSEHDGCLNCW